jgi:hypothetical protein
MKQIGVHETTTQEQMQIERKTKLRRKIDTWMGVQQLFIPEVAVLRDWETVEQRCVAAMQARGSNAGAARPQGAGHEVLVPVHDREQHAV